MRLRKKKQSSGAGAIDLDDGILDEILSGLDDVYDIDE
jgi:hypothetical protein